MPVTIKVASHPSTAVSERWRKTTSTQTLLARTSERDGQSSKGIIQSSFTNDDFETTHLVPSNNGFVNAAFYAYRSHHHLTIRPDDVWFAILSQLSFYINANAEALRDHFVSHQGQKSLVVSEVGTIKSVDIGALARRMTALIQENVKDPNLRDWIMPAFSTTTVNDRTTAAVLMMGTMQAYFSYGMCLLCGIPSVTLLGERADYQDILDRLDKLPELGQEAATFANLLRPVLRRFIATFDSAQDEASRDFWGRIAHEFSGGSGPSYLGGWITAFCFWNEKGECMYDVDGDDDFDDRPNSKLELDGVVYHRVEVDDIPAGYAAVPVSVNDNGKEFKTKMVAGSLGIKITKSGDSEVGADGEEVDKLDSLQSLSGWIMYEYEDEAQGCAQDA